jgi:hypothetical protein
MINKSYFRSKEHNGFKWGGQLSEGNQFYVKGDYRTGFKEIQCTNEDLENGNFIYMADNGLTRDLK